MYGVRGTYDDCSRLSVELSFELDWGFVNVGLRSYYAEGSATLAFEIAEQLGWRLPDAVACPIASGALFSKLHQGFSRLQELALVREGTRRRGSSAGRRRAAPRSPRRSPETAAWSRRARARSSARSRSATPPTATWRLRPHAPRAARSTRCRRRRSERRWRFLAESAGVFGETAAGVTLGALREAVRRGELGASDRVVLLVTGDGLKTPDPVKSRLRTVEVEPNADAILARSGVAA